MWSWQEPNLPDSTNHTREGHLNRPQIMTGHPEVSSKSCVYHIPLSTLMTLSEDFPRALPRCILRTIEAEHPLALLCQSPITIYKAYIRYRTNVYEDTSACLKALESLPHPIKNECNCLELNLSIGEAVITQSLFMSLLFTDCLQL